MKARFVNLNSIAGKPNKKLGLSERLPEKDSTAVMTTLTRRQFMSPLFGDNSTVCQINLWKKKIPKKRRESKICELDFNGWKAQQKTRVIRASPQESIDGGNDHINA